MMSAGFYFFRTVCIPVFLLLGFASSVYGSDSARLDSMLAAANSFLDQQENERAKPILYSILQTESISIPSSILRSTYANLGYLYYVTLAYDSSAYFYQKAIEISLEQQDTLQMIKTIRSKGMALGQKGLLGFAAEAYNQGGDWAKKSNNIELLAEINNSMGILYQRAGNLEKSLFYYQESLANWSQRSDSLRVAFAYNNIARCHLDMLQLDSSLYYNKLALTLKTATTDDPVVLVSTINNLGKTYLLLDSLSKAESYLNQGYQIHKELGDREGIIISLNNLTQLAIRKGELNAAKSYLDSCKLLLADLDLKELLADHLALRTNYWELTGNLKEALADYKAFVAVRSQLFEEERLNVQEVEATYLLEDQRYQKELAQMEAIVTKAESTRNFRLAIGLVVFVLLLSFLAIRLWIAYKREQMLKAEIGNKNELINLQKLDLKHRTNNLLNRIRSIISEASSNVVEPKAKEEFQRSERILISSALLEKSLYSVEDLSEVPICSYLRELVELNKDMTKLEGREISFSFTFIEEFLLPSQTVLDCGMIINELIMNSLKHAFHQEDFPAINVGFSKNEEGVFELSYSDNGSGYTASEGSGVGSWVIESLLISLRGERRLVSDSGTAYKFLFRSSLSKPIKAV